MAVCRGTGAITRHLITGGAGFIGSHLADALVRRGDEVAVLDEFSTGRRENVEQLAASGSAELIEGSVTHGLLIERLIMACDCCLHLASAVGVHELGMEASGQPKARGRLRRPAAGSFRGGP
jgi:nucleoside-diphosphate-sugar epimerase